MDGVTWLDDYSSALRCIACRAALTHASLDRCSRCGADNRAWRVWAQAGWRQHFRRFFLGSPWGRLALVSLLLPPVTWLALGVGPLSFEAAALFASLMLSLGGLSFLFAGRDALRIYELARRVAPRFQIGLLPLGGAGFLVFAAVGGALGLGWGLAVLGGDPPAFIGTGRGGAALVAGLAFTAQSLAAGLYAAFAYGRWLSRAFPGPVFLDQARLFQLVDRTTKPRIQVKTGGTYEAVTTQVVALSRTHGAGLDLVIRAETGTNEVLEGHALKAVQHWRVVSDKWGRVIRFEQEGPLEYLPQAKPTYPRFSSSSAGAFLEGEIIPPDKQAPPSVEESIVRAFAADA